MEEKRPGQQPEADRQPDDPAQNRTARKGGQAKGGLEPTGQDRALVRDAAARGTGAAEELREKGFGNSEGLPDSPDLPRSE